MKIEEYQENITKLLSNPDTALAEMDSVMEALKDDLAARDSLLEENEKLKTSISDLRETNIKLYLRSTGENQEPNKEEPEVDPDVAATDEFFENLI